MHDHREWTDKEWTLWKLDRENNCLGARFKLTARQKDYQLIKSDWDRES